MTSTFADTEAAEELINNHDDLSEDSEVVQRLEDFAENVPRTVEAVPNLERYDDYAAIGGIDAVDQVIKAARGPINTESIASVRADVEAFAEQADLSESLEDQMEEDDDFNVFRNIEGEVVIALDDEDTHDSIENKFKIDDGSGEDGTYATEFDTGMLNGIEEGDAVALDSWVIDPYVRDVSGENADEPQYDVTVNFKGTSVSDVQEVEHEYDLSTGEDMTVEGTVSDLVNPDGVLDQDHAEGDDDHGVQMRLRITEDGEEMGIFYVDEEEALGLLEESKDDLIEAAKQDLSSDPAGLATLSQVVNSQVAVEATSYPDGGYYVTDIEMSNEDRLEAALDEA